MKRALEAPNVISTLMIRRFLERATLQTATFIVLGWFLTLSCFFWFPSFKLLCLGSFCKFLSLGFEMRYYMWTCPLKGSLRTSEATLVQAISCPLLGV